MRTAPETLALQRVTGDVQSHSANYEIEGTSAIAPTSITLTGDRNSTRVKMMIGNEVRWVPYGLAALLIQLVIARHKQAEDGTGFVQLHKKSAHDLRKAIGRRDIIEVSGGKEGEDHCDYRLRFLPYGRFRVERNVRELVGLRVRKTVVLTLEQYQSLLKIADAPVTAG